MRDNSSEGMRSINCAVCLIPTSLFTFVIKLDLRLNSIVCLICCIRHMEHLILYHTRQALRRRRILRDRLNPLRYYDATEVKKIFRFYPETITQITALVQPVLQHPTGRSSSLAPKKIENTLPFTYIHVVQPITIIISAV